MKGASRGVPFYAVIGQSRILFGFDEPWDIYDRVSDRPPHSGTLEILSENEGRILLDSPLQMDGQSVNWIKCSPRHTGNHMLMADLIVNFVDPNNKFFAIGSFSVVTDRTA